MTVARKPKGDKPATYNVHVDVGEVVDSTVGKMPKRRRTLSEAEIREIKQSAAEWNMNKPRRKNAASQAEINKFVADMDEVTLYASAAYGRRPSIRDWQNGKDFFAVNPQRWNGGPYFSIRDVQRIYDLGYRKIIFGGAEGFDVELVMQ